ncbi:MAG: transglutaminase-like domain-containing protein [Brumimicrobium sp.]
MEEYLIETDYLDFSSPAVKELVKPFIDIENSKEKAIKLYYEVRDKFLYDPYHLNLRHEYLKASVILKKNRAWCVEKSIVLAAALRAVGIPARLGYGIVVNHIGVEKLTSYLKREEIVFHGYVDVFIEGKWVKTTPAFDEKVCKLSGVPPLDWDGKTDAMFQAYSGDKKFMEYIHFYGTFPDVPVELMNAEMKKYYPHLFEEEFNERRFSFIHL